MLGFASFGLDVMAVPLRGSIVYDVLQGYVRFCYMDDGDYYPFPLVNGVVPPRYLVRYSELMSYDHLFQPGSKFARSGLSGRSGACSGLFSPMAMMRHSVELPNYGCDDVVNVDCLMVYSDWFMDAVRRWTVFIHFAVGDYG